MLPLHFLLLAVTLIAEVPASRSTEVTWKLSGEFLRPEIHERRVRNSRQCERLCEYSANCHSATFHAPSAVCSLHSRPPDDPSAQPQTGNDVTHGTDVSGGSCTSAPCSVGEHCVPVLQGTQHVCLDASKHFHCPGDPPPVPNADGHVTQTSLHATANYACRESFTFFGSSSHVTCADSFSWEGLNGTCLQTAWNNLNMRLDSGIGDWEKLVPMPVGPGWKVEVTGTLTQRKSVSINIEDGADVRLHFGMRLEFRYWWNTTVLNDRENNTWNTQKTIRNAPWRVNSTFSLMFVIDANASSFQIFHNGSLYATFEFSKRCIPVTGIRCAGNLLLYSVRMIYPSVDQLTSP